MEYKNIESKMKMWRKGYTEFPKEYEQYHMTLATKAIEELKTQGYTIHREYSEYVGDLYVIHLIVEKRSKPNEIKMA